MRLLRASALGVIFLTASIARAANDKSDQETVRICADRLGISPKYRSLKTSVYRLTAERATEYGRTVDDLVILHHEIRGEALSVMIAALPPQIYHGSDLSLPLPAGVITFGELNRSNYRELLEGSRRVGDVVVSMATLPSLHEGTVTGEPRDRGSVFEIQRKFYVVIAVGSGEKTLHPQLTLAEFEDRPKPGSITTSRRSLILDPGGEMKLNTREVRDIFKVGAGRAMLNDLVGPDVHRELTTFVAWTDQHEPREQLTYEITVSRFAASE